MCWSIGHLNGAGTSRFPIVHPSPYNYRHLAHQHHPAHHEIIMMQSRSNGVVGNSNGTSSLTTVPSAPFSSSNAAWPYNAGSGMNSGGTLTGTSSHHHNRIAQLHHQQHPSAATTMLLQMSNTNNNTMNVMNGVVVGGNNRGKPRRGMMRRAVFSDAQRKGLERRFQVQKYISKPDRKRLADKLSLKDSQVICSNTHFYKIISNVQAQLYYSIQYNI